MKIIQRKKQKSIKIRVINIFIWILIVMIIVFYISFSLKKNIIKEYNKSMNTSIMLSNLSIEINKCIGEFDKYMKNREKENFERYTKSKDEINRILIQIDKDIEDKYSAIFLRNLKNMFDYHIALTNEILFQEQLNIDTYVKLMELKTLFSYMNKHSQMLSTAYLDYSSQQYSKLLKKYKTADENIYTVFILFALIISTFAVKMLKDILTTIDNLSKSAQLLSNANWEVPDIRKSSYKELDALANAFNHMKKSIKSFIEELNKKAELENNLNKERLKNVEKDKLLKESQLKALQVQMDPHFLFNTLNTVSRMAMFEGADRTVKLTQSVSKILRYNLTHMGKMVKLQEELTVLKAYAIIQETRFQDQMTFKFNIDKDIGHILIPPMIIQPVVENAIIHGLQNTVSEGRIIISIMKKKDYIEIKVSDNGIGMKEDISKYSVEYNNSINKGNTTRIGLSNIRKRLKLHFDRDDLIKIDSKQNIGTTVSVLIPLKVGEENAKAYDC
ncbi:sensor histidine kinase [Paramaledivibacter caminithermalis]|jgi:sensor histidine kinase YesM|uniref:histidine kinase n=1 Tax=Paramaledivibacter caminithermalis (strain DSM 15212 / CIP 107654 / DViRD3) TaxID=1121301 RepID=A0A1M6NTB4_PARC5|nr:sensor histidine kinase [Paramaledivibacter caminithermalis]SHJ98969.1 Histidine kinase-, DNA gyrase B-, and HSP90-like ATPase [Paramaledivibacter caminithermalis DSM 15212]